MGELRFFFFLLDVAVTTVDALKELAKISHRLNSEYINAHQ